MYSPLIFENESLNKPKQVFPNIELRELTPEEVANKKPKGRFQLRAEAHKINGSNYEGIFLDEALDIKKNNYEPT